MEYQKWCISLALNIQSSASGSAGGWRVDDGKIVQKDSRQLEAYTWEGQGSRKGIQDSHW